MAAHLRWNCRRQEPMPGNSTVATTITMDSRCGWQAAGCAVVTGEKMFVGQAAEQFRLFTGMVPPVDLMTQVVLDSLKA